MIENSTALNNGLFNFYYDENYYIGLGANHEFALQWHFIIYNENINVTNLKGYDLSKQNI